MSRQMNNSYFALRHGRSEANEEGIVVCDPANGVPRYGLSESGRIATREKLTADMPAFRFRRGSTITLSSDFRRARETAELFCELGDLEAPRLDERLRERFFGELELKADDGYDVVWEHDARDGDHHHLGCESPNEVAARIRALIEEVEDNVSGQHIVFVSHGDTLQITQTIFRGMAPNEHRGLAHLENAEIRRLDNMA